MKVLIAEDDGTLARSLARGLRERGDHVDVGRDGDEASSLANTSAYELVVLEARLPKKNGFQLARELRRNGVTVPILMLTPRGSVEDVVRGLDSGADDYLPKPFRFDDLVARIGMMQRPRVAAG
jgi:DNA-binding response OmpR family regulator